MSLIFLLFLSLQLHLSLLSSSSSTTASAARHLHTTASSCPLDFDASWIAEGCINITTLDAFEGNVSKSALDDAVKACNQSLGNGSPCASCTTSLSSLQPSNLNGRSIGNLSDCMVYPSIYVAVFINRFGPTDEDTANCLFGFDFSDLSNSNGRVRTIVICVVLIGPTMCEVFMKKGEHLSYVQELRPIPHHEELFVRIRPAGNVSDTNVVSLSVYSTGAALLASCNKRNEKSIELKEKYSVAISRGATELQMSKIEIFSVNYDLKGDLNLLKVQYFTMLGVVENQEDVLF
ncbi:hypothetical protein TEA_028469 [Camellia sinensis var. sinensis]|uniref:SPARK domain-containing protein n=1 Tax=Camellia sinensis var. sinensis TaxID=542762 RepID=A0A4S4E9N4_CAMSN|nr:hypothetical protein TEA_028469 [Camellia sinensis var. sinensis]